MDEQQTAAFEAIIADLFPDADTDDPWAWDDDDEPHYKGSHRRDG